MTIILSCDNIIGQYHVALLEGNFPTGNSELITLRHNYISGSTIQHDFFMVLEQEKLQYIHTIDISNIILISTIVARKKKIVAQYSVPEFSV